MLVCCTYSSFLAFVSCNVHVLFLYQAKDVVTEFLQIGISFHNYVDSKHFVTIK